MEEAVKIKIELLEDAMKLLQEELKEAHDYLSALQVPTNGVDANGNVGWGKRENLTLKQRLTYVNYVRKSLNE